MPVTHYYYTCGIDSVYLYYEGNNYVNLTEIREKSFRKKKTEKTPLREELC